MTVAEVADELRCSPATIYEMIRGCELPGVVRVGRLVRVNRYALQTFMAGTESPLHKAHDAS